MMQLTSKKDPSSVTDVLVKAVSAAIDSPTDEMIRRISVAIFHHNREYPESFVTCYTRQMHKMIEWALKYKSPEMRIDELRRVDDRAYRLPNAVRDALEQRKA